MSNRFLTFCFSNLSIHQRRIDVIVLQKHLKVLAGQSCPLTLANLAAGYFLPRFLRGSSLSYLLHHLWALLQLALGLLAKV